MKKIKLTKERFALVDDEDFEFLNQFNWGYSHEGYAVRTETYIDISGIKKQRTIRMHIILMNPEKGLLVDHIDGDRIDNRKENLRIVTYLQNGQNKKGRDRFNTSQFKGVYYHKRDKIWSANIGYNNDQKHLGNFKTEIEAARAYNKAALELHGEFAKLNEVA